MDGWLTSQTNTTHYIDPYDTPMDQNLKKKKKKRGEGGVEKSTRNGMTMKVPKWFKHMHEYSYTHT